MTKQLLTIIVIVGVCLLTGTVFFPETRSVAAESPQSTAVFDSDGKMKLPTGYRAWVFVGAPLTPNGLNNGKANFPEYHNVYVEKKNVDAYLKTGEFPEGTVIVKELTLVLNPDFPDGSRKEPSGRGYFNGAFNGIDVSVKDSSGFLRPTAGAISPSGITLCPTIRRPPKSPWPNVLDAISPMSEALT